MTTMLQQGGNAPMPPQGPWTIVVTWHPAALQGRDVDASALLLAETGKVRGDHDLIFYNQPAAADGSVRIADAQGRAEPGVQRFTVQPERIVEAVTKVVFVLTIHDAGSVSFTQADRVMVDVLDAQGTTILQYDAEPKNRPEAALILGELYRYRGQWKFRAVGQGFVGGLDPLARHFGVTVEAPPAPTPTPTPVPPPPAPPAPPPPPPVTSRVNLSKITLEKKGQSVSLAKKSEGFGQIRINLNWSRPGGAGAPSAPRPSGGFFGKLFGGVAGSGGIDLDLGCFIELNNGTRTVVQALGNQFGDLEREPYIRLSRDDRTGMVTEGEDLLLNGTRWSQVRRVLIYAFIYQGAANWDATDGVVTVYVPNEPPLEVRLTHGRNDRGMCAIASLENVDNGLRVTKLVEYFRDHREMDQTYRWGFRWSAGSKD